MRTGYQMNSSKGDAGDDKDGCNGSHLSHRTPERKQLGGKISTHQEVDMLYSLVLMKHRQGILRIADVFARQEKVYFFSHFLTLFLFISALFGGAKSVFFIFILSYYIKICGKDTNFSAKNTIFAV